MGLLGFRERRTRGCGGGVSGVGGRGEESGLKGGRLGTDCGVCWESCSESGVDCNLDWRRSGLALALAESWSRRRMVLIGWPGEVEVEDSKGDGASELGELEQEEESGSGSV